MKTAVPCSNPNVSPVGRSIKFDQVHPPYGTRRVGLSFLNNWLVKSAPDRPAVPLPSVLRPAINWLKRNSPTLPLSDP